MKKILFIAALSTTAIVYAQHDTIVLGTTNREFFIKGDQKYRFSEYKKVFTNPEALAYMRKSNTNGTVAQVFGALGGAFMGYGLAQELFFKKQTAYHNGVAYEIKRRGGWGIAGIGLGMVGVSIPFAIGAGKNMKKAIRTQNDADAQSTAETPKTSYRLDVNGNGVGLTYNF